MAIRPEEPRDHAAIGVVTQAAFADAPHSDGSEVRIIERLRADGDLALSLVAEDCDRIVGHVAISPVEISDGSVGWYGLGPIAVLPSLQRQKIGSRLMQRAIADMRMQGARGLVLLGDPVYYARFGFEHDPALRYPGPPPEYFQRLVVAGDAPSGDVRYARAFG
ncbi:MAG: GNAT family N-acetyltransferase [Sphingomonadaceae bacterium]|uniref:N-acetyltransferase n=1 Tax=Erythrobacter aureus TaxID=2182384 RepID=A0A345YHK5_9SPHN|nr:N-acetyltransferase [Erythrobacter aureus]MBL45612.1 GNAT family N-acetyltransferase [Sphingomonadaceae bacterium]